MRSVHWYQRGQTEFLENKTGNVDICRYRKGNINWHWYKTWNVFGKHFWQARALISNKSWGEFGNNMRINCIRSLLPFFNSLRFYISCRWLATGSSLIQGLASHGIDLLTPGIFWSHQQNGENEFCSIFSGSDVVTRIPADGSAAFNESCAPIG